MGGLPTNDFYQVHQPGLRLKGKHLPIGELPMKGQRYPCPVHFPLIQRTLNVKEVGHRPWHREVHGADLPYQAF